MDEQFASTVKNILKKDGRYHADAYDFINSAVAYTITKHNRNRKPRGTRHVSGAELVEGTMEYAVEQFGALAPIVLREWGLVGGPDVGNVVFNMIDAGLLSASPDDALSDFNIFPDMSSAMKDPLGPCEINWKNRESLKIKPPIIA